MSVCFIFFPILAVCTQRIDFFFHEVRSLEYNVTDSGLYEIGKIVDEAKKAQACVRLKSNVSDKTTEFMASKPFGDGDKQAVSCSIYYLSCFQFSVLSLLTLCFPTK